MTTVALKEQVWWVALGGGRSEPILDVGITIDPLHTGVGEDRGPSAHIIRLRPFTYEISGDFGAGYSIPLFIIHQIIRHSQRPE